MNLLEYAKIFQAELDKQMLAGATSGWMEDNAGQVKYNGGDEVKIPIIDMNGLADYDRTDGFTKGAVTNKFKTYTLTQDRGRTFSLDRMDVDETNFAIQAGNVMGEFQRTKVIPEIDAYRYSKIAAIAIEHDQSVNGGAPTEATILKKLLDDIADIQDEVGEDVELVITMSIPVAKILSSSEKIQKRLDVADFKKGDINFKVKTIDGIPIITAPSARMKTEYLIKTGGTGQTEGGFIPTENAKNINWIITPRRVPIAVSKTDKIRIFEPDTNQVADAWKLDYRKYHDLWILHNKINSIKVNIA